MALAAGFLVGFAMGFADFDGLEDLGVTDLEADLEMGLGLIGWTAGLAALMVLVVDLFGVRAALDGAFLGRRTVRPSIDLFLSIVYNYSIWVLN